MGQPVYQATALFRILPKLSLPKTPFALSALILSDPRLQLGPTYDHNGPSPREPVKASMKGSSHGANRGAKQRGHSPRTIES